MELIFKAIVFAAGFSVILGIAWAIWYALLWLYNLAALKAEWPQIPHIGWVAVAAIVALTVLRMVGKALRGA